MQKKNHGISYFAAHITMIVSITLVLLIVGTIALMGVAAGNAGRQIRGQVELSVIMQDSVSNEQTQALVAQVGRMPFAAQCRLITKEQALQDWQEQTGENLVDVFGVNPLSPEICVQLRPEFAVQDSVSAITSRLNALPGVEGVAEPDTQMVAQMNDNISNLSLVLGVIALALIVISFVLINNTVHLSIYSRRFSIHTMQLVGATNGFIRRPFVANSIVAGLISAVVAGAVLWGAYEYLVSGDLASLTSYVSRGELALVVMGLFVFGALMCGVAALFATNRYLRMKYDQLFKV